MSPRVGILALLPFLAVATPAAAASSVADTVAFVGHRVTMSAGGDAVLGLTVVLAAPGPAEVLLPFGFERADSFTVRGVGATFPSDSLGRPAPLRRSARRRLLALDLDPSAAAGETLEVHCRLRKFVDWEEARGQFGAYTLARTFVNDADVSVGTYRLVLELPQGYQVRRITATEPAYKPEDSPVPPYRVGALRDRGIASLTAAHLRPGGRARLAIQAERIRRSPVPLLAGAVLVLLYLWFFRDLTAARMAGPNATGRP